MDRPGVRQVPEGSKEQRKMEETGCKIIGGAPTTIAVDERGAVTLSKLAFPGEGHSDFQWEKS